MIESNKLISIILPVYNGESYLASAIESCLNQTYTNIELIIVNDCSKDNSLKIAENYAKTDSRVTVINNQENKKLPASLNVGHQAAKGQLLTWTSHDNIYEPNAIEELSHPIFSGEAAIVYADLFLIDDGGEIKKEIFLPEIETLIFGNCVGASFLYDREVYERNQGYDENLFLVEDYDFWIRAFKHSKYKHLHKSFYKYRTHEDSLSSGIKFNDEKQKLWKENCSKMYSGFFASYLDNYKGITDIFTNKLTAQYIDFSSLKKESKNIDILKTKLKENINIRSAKMIESVFLKQSIEIMVNSQNGKSNLSKCMFIAKKYISVLDKNSVKTLIKYSFFK